MDQNSPHYLFDPTSPGWIVRRHSNGEHVSAEDVTRVLRANPDYAPNDLIIGLMRRALLGELPKPREPPHDERAERLLRAGHNLLAEHSMSPLNLESHPEATAPSFQRTRRTMSLGLLAPEIQREILEGRPTHSIDTLLSGSLPLAWADQRELLTM